MIQSRPTPRPRAALLARSARAMLLAAAMAAQAGCGGEPRQESVSGGVSLDGKPLGNGTIQFRPDVGKGLAVGSLVREGRYALPNPPGLAPGRYKVAISARGGSVARPDMPPDFDLANPAAKDPVPPRYNERTVLQAEVTAGGSNTFDFELSGKPDPALDPAGASKR